MGKVKYTLEFSFLYLSISLLSIHLFYLFYSFTLFFFFFLVYLSYGLGLYVLSSPKCYPRQIEGGAVDSRLAGSVERR